MIKSILKFSVLKIKGRTITFDKKVRNIDLLSLFFSQGFAVLRGLLKVRKMVSLGRDVRVLAKHNAYLGKGVSIGNYSTIDALGTKGFYIGAGSSIGSFSILKVSGTLTSIGKEIKVGSNVGIGDFAHIGGAGGVVIGDNTIAGAYLSIHPENHVFSDTNELIRKQGVTRKGVSIGENCWIGAKVTILDGTVIGDGCIIAAGAVVIGSFPDNVIIGGVPAKILKQRVSVNV